MSLEQLDWKTAAFAEARKRYPDLSPLIDLEEGLHAAQLNVAGFIPEIESIDEERIRAAWAQGNPAFTFDDFHLDWGTFSWVLAWLGGILIGSLNPMSQGEASWRINQLAHGDLMELSWLVRGVYEGESQGDLEDNLISAAFKPFFWEAWKAVEPWFDPREWSHGWCPLCGAGPDFASLSNVSGPRTLYCSRCDSHWHFQRAGCPFCGTNDQRKLGYYPSGDDFYRLYACLDCKRYLKTVDPRELGRDILLPLDRAVTYPIDQAAKESGYL